MGFGDERGNVESMYTATASKIADQLYRDMDTIPGGESARSQWNTDREQAAKQGAFILLLLSNRGLVDIDKIDQEIAE